MTGVGDREYKENGEMNKVGILVGKDDHGDAEPRVGMKFSSDAAAKTFYDDYARNVGFSTRDRKTMSDGTFMAREFGCAQDMLKRRPGDSCGAKLRIESKNQKEWVVTEFVKEHSHSIMSSKKVHYIRPRRHFAGAAKSMAESYRGTGIIPSGLMSISINGNHVPLEINHGARSANLGPDHTFKSLGYGSYSGSIAGRKRTLGKNAQNLLDYFNKMQAENPGFYYAIQVDDDNRMANAFWADSRSRTAYSHFGDAVTLDTIYRVNQFTVPFTPFTGVNHHGQTILFGCALLQDESEATFIWLFKTFLTAMNNHAPVSIITDQDKAIQAAARVFPETRHCISKWHVLREGQLKLGHICHAYPNFQVDLYNCINMTVTAEEFELAWDCILDKYDIRMNEWIQLLYNARKQWVPVYFRDTFFAAISDNQGHESSFFDGYVNQETTVPMFFRQYERALENSFKEEIEADFDTMCTTPVLMTPSPMEKQAANLYTKKVFLKFQKELVETFVYTADRLDGDESISKYRVAKFEDDHRTYIVSLDLTEMRAGCSCQMFEYSGILCRHILTVFTVTNVLTLPSHYILRRWTRNAKSWVGSDDCGESHGQESLGVRYNSLCREAIKYAEEGAIAPETYNVARAALREGGKKVMSLKKTVARVARPSSQVRGIGYEESRTSSPDMTPLLWPRQDEVTGLFNLNDAGVPNQPFTDLNLPRMAPVSLHHDDDNKAVLPCLKSMTWVMENKNAAPENRVAVIKLKLQDYSRTPSAEREVKFSLSACTLEPMLRSMASISEQMPMLADKVAVINLKVHDTVTSSGESGVKFKVSRDTLGAMLRSMAYIREQLSNAVETHLETQSKKPRKL